MKNNSAGMYIRDCKYCGKMFFAVIKKLAVYNVSIHEIKCRRNKRKKKHIYT